MIMRTAGLLAVLLLIANTTWSATPAQIESSRAHALAWLIAHQQDDGRWTGHREVDVPATAQAVEALQTAGVTNFAYARGLAWLANVEPASVESVARKAAALENANLGANAAVLTLVSWRNRLYGWGAYDKFESSLPDTALAVRAIRGSDRFASERANLIHTLSCVILPSQGAGNPAVAGSWSYTASADSLSGIGRDRDVSPTVHNLLEIAAFADLGYSQFGCDDTTYPLANALNAGADWLLSQRRNADGSFGMPGAGNPLETALAYTAIQRIRPNEVALASAHDYLLSTQAADGSWQGDAFVTATVLKTLGSSVLTDTDSDGVPDAVELVLRTNPSVSDSRSFAGRNGRSESGVTEPISLSASINRPFSRVIAADPPPSGSGVLLGDLPEGLTLNLASGALSGTPTSAGYYNFLYQYVDASSVSHSILVQIAVAAALDTTPPVVTAPVAMTLEATAVLSHLQLGQAYAVDETDGPLPPTPVPSGPLPVGTHTITWQAVDKAGNVGT
jgi:hypothetical protein